MLPYREIINVLKEIPKLKNTSLEEIRQITLKMQNLKILTEIEEPNLHIDDVWNYMIIN
ncbi:MAG: hypothetical protein Ta2E_01040 [Mycoplasmoidaceae bacterium]|nr:MAG: hypothetical protein Ta2E_01040 [Mycoplasmoidaceae bacterium]